MNPIILLPAMGKIVGQTRIFSLGEATSLGEGKSEFKPFKLSLNNWPCDFILSDHGVGKYV